MNNSCHRHFNPLSKAYSQQSRHIAQSTLSTEQLVLVKLATWLGRNAAKKALNNDVPSNETIH